MTDTMHGCTVLYMLTTATFAPEFKSECRIRYAADCYHLNVSALNAGKITPDQHRAENRRIKADLTETEWQVVKVRVLSRF